MPVLLCVFFPCMVVIITTFKRINIFVINRLFYVQNFELMFKMKIYTFTDVVFKSKNKLGRVFRFFFTSKLHSPCATRLCMTY